LARAFRISDAGSTTNGKLKDKESQFVSCSSRIKQQNYATRFI